VVESRETGRGQLDVGAAGRGQRRITVRRIRPVEFRPRQQEEAGLDRLFTSTRA
jgi:hypothetical protein